MRGCRRLLQRWSTRAAQFRAISSSCVEAHLKSIRGPGHADTPPAGRYCAFAFAVLVLSDAGQRSGSYVLSHGPRAVTEALVEAQRSSFIS